MYCKSELSTSIIEFTAAILFSNLSFLQKNMAYMQVNSRGQGWWVFVEGVFSRKWRSENRV